MNDSIAVNEKLLRAVLPRFWNSTRLSSAAFKDKRGLSVDRTGDRLLTDSVERMKCTFTGYVVSLSVPTCNTANVCLRYMPSARNKYHCEIHGSPKEKELNDTQALVLARNITVEFNPNFSFTI